jgi:MFS family permease
LALVAVVDAVIVAVLPACFREIGQAFEATQSSLGGVLFVRGLAQAGAALLAGVSSSRVDRPILILAGCWTWGVGAAFIGVAPNFGCMLVAVALNGVGAGVLKPVLISMLADLAPVGGSGKTFSLYDFTNSVSGVLGATIATVIAPLDIPFIGGAWRLLFLALSAVAGLLGGAVGLLTRDPRGGAATRPAAVGALAAFTAVAKIKTFWAIIFQGAFGSMPWQAIGFMTLYFELGCFSNAAAATLFAVFRTGCALGALLGGVVGDALDHRSPNHGRPCTALISVGSGLPFSFLLLIVMTPWLGNRDALLLFGAALFAMGICTTWCASGVNRPIFAAIVRRELRPTIYALDAVLEGAVGSFGSLAVGVLADRYLLIGGAAASSGGRAGEGDAALAPGGTDSALLRAGASCAETRPAAIALGRALFASLNAPWAICFAAYCYLHFTYGKDRRRLERELAIAAAKDSAALAQCAA